MSDEGKDKNYNLSYMLKRKTRESHKHVYYTF